MINLYTNIYSLSHLSIYKAAVGYVEIISPVPRTTPCQESGTWNWRILWKTLFFEQVCFVIKIPSQRHIDVKMTAISWLGGFFWEIFMALNTMSFWASRFTFRTHAHDLRAERPTWCNHGARLHARHMSIMPSFTISLR